MRHLALRRLVLRRLALAALAASGCFPFAAQAEVNTLISTSALAIGDGTSDRPSFDQNGRFAVFASVAGNLLPGQDTGGLRHLFLHDRIARTLQLVSHIPSDPLKGGNTGVETRSAVISADGNWVLYCSRSTDLVSNQVDQNAAADVFLWSRATDTNLLVSHRADLLTGTGNDESTTALTTGIALSRDGRYAAFNSTASDLVTGYISTNFRQVYLFDRNSGNIELITHASGNTLQGGNGASELDFGGGLKLAADGRVLVLSTKATDLINTVNDSNNTFDVYLWNRRTPVRPFKLLSRQAGSPTTAVGSLGTGAAISADGSAAIFVSSASNVEGTTSDTNGGTDLFRYDVDGDFVELVSHRGNSITSTGDGEAGSGSLSADGLRIAFQSEATNHVFQQVDTNSASDIFFWSGSIVLMSHLPGLPQQTGNGDSFRPLISADGRGVAFTSRATDLVPQIPDNNTLADVFFRPRNRAEVFLLSHLPDESATGSQGSFADSIALGGALVAYSSDADDLAPGDTNLAGDLFVHGSLIMADSFESGDLSAWSLHVP